MTKSIFIFGAGFSKGVLEGIPISSKEITSLTQSGVPIDNGKIDFPLISNLFERLYNFLEWRYKESPIYKQFRIYLEVYWDFTSQQDAKQINIEELITSLQIASESGLKLSPDNLDPKSILEFVLLSLQTYILGLGMIIKRIKGVSKRVIDIISIPSEKRAILTFNWDLLIDYSFHLEQESHIFRRFPYQPNVMYGFTPSLIQSKGGYTVPQPGLNEVDVPIYKLHGSLNWRYCYECNRTAIDEFEDPGSFDDRFRVCPYDKSKFLLDIITPTWLKKFERNPYIPIWRMAEKELEQADQVIVIGYRMADPDYHTKEMFRRAVRSKPQHRKLILVDPNTNDHNFVSKFSNVFGIKEIKIYTSITSYLESEMKST